MVRLLRSAGALMVPMILLAAATAGAQPPQAHVATTCSVGTGHGFGYTYLDKLTVTRTSCGTGKAVAKSHGHTRGWRCSTRRLQSSPIQYVDQVSCTSRSSRVVYVFTQNT